jgi:2-polyprenyl-3-methyl-5-hydroxy-6-metoxy-1,4-benzoquinol methylase
MNNMQPPEFTRYADIQRRAFIVKQLRAHLPNGATVLDIGCGNGIISRAIGEAGYNVHGIDRSEAAIATARQTNRLPNVHFEIQDAEDLIIQGKTYDAVVCSEVLEHLNNPSGLLKEIEALLTPNGIVLVTVPNGKGPRETCVTRPIQRLKKSNSIWWRGMNNLKKSMGYKGTTVQSAASDLDHIQFFTVSQLTELARKHHFKIAAISGSNFLDDVFPFSLIGRRSLAVQKIDFRIAQKLPVHFSGGFFMLWVRQPAA